MVLTYDSNAGLDPDEFVEDMKKKGIRVPGIGHRIKSKVGMCCSACDLESKIKSVRESGFSTEELQLA